MTANCALVNLEFEIPTLDEWPVPVDAWSTGPGASWTSHGLGHPGKTAQQGVLVSDSGLARVLAIWQLRNHLDPSFDQERER